MTYEQIVADIKNKKFAPVYFLMGDEPYFIDTISGLIEDTALDEAEKAFNQIIIYGRDVDSFSEVTDQARSFPMMGERLVVIVKEAQSIKESEFENLEKYLNDIPPTTVLVINYKYKKLDKRRSLSKLIDKKGVLFEAKKLYENNIPTWIKNTLAEDKFQITPKAAQMLADFIGNDLLKIKNELKKLTIAVTGKKTIDDSDIEYNIGISKDFNIFELQNALGSRNMFKALQIASYFGDNPKENPMAATAAILYIFFTKILKYHYCKDKKQSNVASVLGINPFFVKDYELAARNYSVERCAKAIEMLRQYDMYSKGYGSINTSDKDLYKELIMKIMQ